MIRVAWRQFRLRCVLAVVVLIALAILVIPTGLHQWDSLYPIRPSLCRSINDRSHCGDLMGTGPSQLGSYLGALLLAIPPLLGMFWGAPLVAGELEGGTHRLAWTQSVSRQHWLTVKLLLVGGTSVLVSAVASALITWWYAPDDMVNLNRLNAGIFAQRGSVVVGYTAFAIALGVAAGALIRRVLPAMVATLVGYAAVWEAFSLWVRPHLLAAAHTVVVYRYGARIPGAWVQSATLHVDPVRLSRARFDALWLHTCQTTGFKACRPFPRDPGHALLQYITYQPASRFWPLQIFETGLFLIAALAIAWLVFQRFAPRFPGLGGGRRRMPQLLRG